MPLPQPLDAHLDPAFRHPIDASRKSALAPRYRELFLEAVGAELAEATRLADHQFTLLGHRMVHNDRIAWSRDPVSGREWSRRFSRDIPYRGPARLGDIKLPWELNKHQYFFTLGKAAWLTGDAAPALEIVRQIDHWIDDNPPDSGIHWISALEAGTRAIAWMMAFPFYAECLDADGRRRLVASLAQHLVFVEQHLSTGPFANTHLIGEAAALVVGGLFIECRHSARWIARGLQILDEELRRQVTDDGVHVERSIAYHRFFLDHYYLVASWLAANGRSLSADTLDRVERMTACLMHMLFADGTVPAFGDGDEARGLWVRADAPADYRGLLALGAVLFGRGAFKAAASGIAEEVLWLFGPDGVAAFDACPSQPLETASVAYPDAGYYVMRSRDGASDQVLVFDCGPLGFGGAGHAHADALSFQLHAAGYPFFVDSGTFSYNIDYAWRDAFRGTRAHNTIVVDGQDQSVPGDRMSWKTVARAHSAEWVTTRWFDLADGEHDGYHRLPDPVSHRRAIFFLKPDVWVIWDQVTASQPHQIDLLFHVRPDCRIEPMPANAGVLLTGPQGQRLRAWIAAGGRQTAGFEVLEGDEQDRALWFSPHYGARCVSRALHMRRDVVGQCGLVTCLTTSEQPRPDVTLQDGAIEIRSTRGGCEQRAFYRAHGDRTYRADGVEFDGGLMFERQRLGDRSIVRASRFRALWLEGRLEVRSTTMIDTLEINEDGCAVAVQIDDPSQLHITATSGMRVIVNGRVN
jgi:uncharacterized heparinase superfamily protein